jgi:signal transduction histidine kinase
MTDPRREALACYRAALEAYARSADENVLASAYELGRRMLESKVEVLDVVSEHAITLEHVLEVGPSSVPAQVHGRATEFLREALAPFAMVIQGYDESIGLLQERVSQLQALDDMKNDFIAMIVHDMKNPLAGARALAEILVLRWDAVEESKRREICASILDCSDSAMRLVNDVLELSRAEHDAATLSPQECDVGDLIRDVARRLGTPEGNRVVVRISENLPAVWADPQRQCQVLENLVSNALKFSPGDRSVVVEAEPINGDLIEIRVHDQGAGIAVADQTRLFRRFSRIATPGYEDVPGSGVGLYAAKRIIEAHGGTVRVESEPGAGSSFCYTVPTAQFGSKYLSHSVRPT